MPRPRRRLCDSEHSGHRYPFIKKPVELGYRLDLLNTDFAVENICEGLNAFRQGRLCLYGPTGTGNTAFGKYLSTLLEMPLISKKASDIISPYLGESERNMLSMFNKPKMKMQY